MGSGAMCFFGLIMSCLEEFGFVVRDVGIGLIFASFINWFLLYSFIDPVSTPSRQDWQVDIPDSGPGFESDPDFPVPAPPPAYTAEFERSYQNESFAPDCEPPSYEDAIKVSENEQNSGQTRQQQQ